VRRTLRAGPPLPIGLRIRSTAIAIVSLLCSSDSRAELRIVELPLVVPLEFLQRLLVEQVFTEPGATARIVAVADPCNEIVLSKPQVGYAGGRLVVTANGEAVAGFSWLGGCVHPFHWEGEIEVEEEARLGPDAPVVSFPVMDSRLRRTGRGWLDAAMLWDWVKPVVHPRLAALRVDLTPLVDELRRMLPLFAARREVAAVRRLAASIELFGAKVEERGLVLELRFEVETAPAEQILDVPEPPLTPEETLAFEAMLRQWDSFVTFVVKIAGRDSLHPARRVELLEVLLEARHELLSALEETEGQGEDRVRALFGSAWTRLAPALVDHVGGKDGFRYLAFVAAGDALAALDAAGPSFGIELSSDGLRRLARTLAPAATEDPLLWSEAVDPTLRETFGFDAPLPALPPPDSIAPTPLPPASDEEPAPLPEDPPEPESSRLRSILLRLAELLVAPAFAAQDPPPPPAPSSSALDAVAPGRAELDAYLPKVAELLRDSASLVFVHGGLERDRLEPFLHLVLAVAWQESCWRQYVERRGRVEPLRSSVGALGLMQVHPRVWRGFYAVDGLAWSIGYNARAGSEILLHYLRDYAIARGEEVVGGPDALARATYAAYHGGPSHLRRYREPGPRKPALAAIDRAFHEKYRSVAAGSELGVRDCFPG
jgi:hypothetical protein